jgi:hypothetical protein
MAKSTRSKTKRSFRRVKRESGVFAVADAARLARLSAKLKNKVHISDDDDREGENDPEDIGDWHAFYLLLGLVDQFSLGVN